MTVVYIDSDTEQHAWLIANLGPTGSWRTTAQTMQAGPDGTPRELLEFELATGDRVSVVFAEASADESLEGEGNDRSGSMDDLMERALVYAAENPPHHPGSMPRFPIPSRAYPGAVSVPMPILASDDDGVRGIYAPPRQVTLRLDDLTLVGVGEYPEFDPESWPPPRLGDWPPAAAQSLEHEQLQAIIARFNCCWSRILEAWMDGRRELTDVLNADFDEAARYRSLLDLGEFEPYYAALNPAFWDWQRGR